MNRILIKKESSAQRCEICHQIDSYDREKNYCNRCCNLTESYKLVHKDSTAEEKDFFEKNAHLFVFVSKRSVYRLIGSVLGILLLLGFARFSISNCFTPRYEVSNKATSLDILLPEILFGLIVGILLGFVGVGGYLLISLVLGNKNFFFPNKTTKNL
ncbi:MAG: sulfite exporter TauE/SafE family protein [Acidobacteria bacterium]|nr:sulfite exporter TauE/SafE family protein [Acidobacteriota bacterium]